MHIRNASIIHVVMVGCICFNCKKWSEVDTDVSFYRIPTVRTNQGKKEYELSLRRRGSFLAAISWENLDVNDLSQRQSDESCKHQTEIAALCDGLSKCYATINELTSKIQQLSVPPFRRHYRMMRRYCDF